MESPIPIGGGGGDGGAAAAAKPMDGVVFAEYAFIFSFARGVVLQPLNLALARVRIAGNTTSSSSTTTTSLFTVSHEIARLAQRPASFGTAMPALVLGTAISETVYLSQYEWLNRKISNHNDNNISSPSISPENVAFLCGFVSEFTRQVVINPFAVIAMYQVQHGGNFSNACQRLVVTCSSGSGSAGGFRCLFAGIGPSLLVGPLWTAMWWYLYSKGKRFFVTDAISPELASSFAASAVTAMMFNPFLVVRARMQAAAAHIPRGEWLRLRFVARQLYHESDDGRGKAAMAVMRRCNRCRSALFAGSVFTVLQSVVEGVAASFIYETSLQYATA